MEVNTTLPRLSFGYAVRVIEIEMARSAHRSLPVDPLRRAALVVEEAGEALKAALDLTRPNCDMSESARISLRQDLYNELKQTAAMAIRAMMAMAQEEVAE
jgi:hypothetical protein